jgi:tetraacyldisaccharide 4'-kinase
MRAPEFWTKQGGLARALAPLGAAYALGGDLRRRFAEPWRAPVPVVCVGNLTVGGTGKTPTVAALARTLTSQGRRVAILSRGYGGRLRGPSRVDPARHGARDVGDEPLLLARVAPVYVARDRKAGAEAAIADGADLLLMDDGFQNPQIEKTLSLVVVDGAAGFGNRSVFPAGPLREPVATGFARAHALVMIGADANAAAFGFGGPVLRADLVPTDKAAWAGVPVVAFAGIGRPQKFFDTLASLGAALRGTYPFADHHAYKRRQIERLLIIAKEQHAVLVTTEKDFVRVPADLAAQIRTVPVELRFADPPALLRLLAQGLAQGLAGGTLK